MYWRCPHLSGGTRAAGPSRTANMRTHTLLSLTLLGLLLWASCFQAEDAEEKSDTPEERKEEAAGQTEEEEEKKDKTTEIEEEKDVLVLHINNFDRALSENQFLLVEFCE